MSAVTPAAIVVVSEIPARIYNPLCRVVLHEVISKIELKSFLKYTQFAVYASICGKQEWYPLRLSPVEVRVEMMR